MGYIRGFAIRVLARAASGEPARYVYPGFVHAVPESMLRVAGRETTRSACYVEVFVASLDGPWLGSDELACPECELLAAGSRDDESDPGSVGH